MTPAPPLAGGAPPLAGAAFDWKPPALVLLLPLLALAAIGRPASWLALTVAGLAMGLTIFILAAAFTLVVRLMEVLDVGHGALGAGVGHQLQQLLLTTGAWVIAGGLIRVWDPHPPALPLALRGPILVGDAALQKFQLVSLLIGLVVLGALFCTLKRNKLGLLIRAGGQNREMVESLGYRMRPMFVGACVAGAALAGLGGVLWGLLQQNAVPQTGVQVEVLIFIAVLIGGLGSITGCLLGALLVGLTAGYAGGVLAPALVTCCPVALAAALLLWRPHGLCGRPPTSSDGARR